MMMVDGGSSDDDDNGDNGGGCDVMPAFYFAMLSPAQNNNK